MPRSISPKTSLDSLKKEAKRWLKALRAGDPAARQRYEEARRHVSAEPTLREVQQALAREYGVESWAADLPANTNSAPPSTGSWPTRSRAT